MTARRPGSVAGFVAAAVVIGFVLQMSASHGQDKKDKVELPKAVMDALKAKFPKAMIDQVTKEKEGDKIVYDIEFKQDGKKFEADIFADGTIHNWEKEIDAKNLPKAVTDAVEKKYPKAKMTEVMEIHEMKDKKEVLEGYEIVLETADKKEVEVTIAPDGKILEDSTDEKKKDEPKKDKK